MYSVVQESSHHRCNRKIMQRKTPTFFLFCAGRQRIFDSSKACQGSGVPTKVLKENADIFADHLHISFNDSVRKLAFYNMFLTFYVFADI